MAERLRYSGKKSRIRSSGFYVVVRAISRLAVGRKSSYTGQVTDLTNNSVPDTGDIEVRLNAAGVQPTAQRVEIARVLLERPRHLSADQLLTILSDNDVKVSKATVYNTLKLLCAKGLVKAVIVDPSRVFYDSTTGPHHHFYNVDKGELTDISDAEVSIENLPPLPAGTVREGVEVIVRIREAARRPHP